MKIEGPKSIIGKISSHLKLSIAIKIPNIYIESPACDNLTNNLPVFVEKCTNLTNNSKISRNFHEFYYIFQHLDFDGLNPQVEFDLDFNNFDKICQLSVKKVEFWKENCKLPGKTSRY